MYRHQKNTFVETAILTPDQELAFHRIHKHSVDLHNQAVQRVNTYPDLSIVESAVLRADPVIRSAHDHIRVHHRVPSRVLRYVTDSVAMTVKRGDRLRKRHVWYSRIKQQASVTFPRDKGFKYKDIRTIHFAGLGDVKFTSDLYDDVTVQRVTLLREDKGWRAKITYVDNPVEFMRLKSKNMNARSLLALADKLTPPKEFIDAVANCPEKDRNAGLLFELFKTLLKVCHDRTLLAADAGKHIGFFKNLIKHMADLYAEDTLDLVAEGQSLTPQLSQKSGSTDTPMTAETWTKIVHKIGEVAVKWEIICRNKAMALDVHENADDLDYLNPGFILAKKDILFGKLDMSKHKKPKPTPKPKPYGETVVTETPVAAQPQAIQDLMKMFEANMEAMKVMSQALANLTGQAPSTALPAPVITPVTAPVTVAAKATPVAPAPVAVPVTAAVTAPGRVPHYADDSTLRQPHYSRKFNNVYEWPYEQRLAEATAYVRKQWPWAFMATPEERLKYLDDTHALGAIDLMHQMLLSQNDTAKEEWKHPEFRTFLRKPEAHEWYSSIGALGYYNLEERGRGEACNMITYMKNKYNLTVHELPGFYNDWMFIPRPRRRD